MADKQFTDGLFADKPSEKAPEFIKARLSFQADKFKAYLDQHKNVAGYVNVDLKESRGGKLYCELNTYKKPEQEMEHPKNDNLTSEGKPIPFPDEKDEIPF